MTTAATSQLTTLLAEFSSRQKEAMEKYEEYLTIRYKLRDIAEQIMKECKHDWEWTEKREFTSGRPTEYVRKTCRRCGLTANSMSELCL